MGLAFSLGKSLRDFSLDIALEVGAETCVLVGESGCGKSTALRMLAGLVEPDTGSVTLDDHVLLDTRQRTSVPPEHRNVGYLVQSYALFPHLSVTDNVAYGITGLGRREQEKQVEEALDLVGVRAMANARPGQLSGGEQQRVALARALARRPGFLLLDEPLSALDVSTRARVRAELDGILDRLDIPTVAVTHDFEDARVLGDHLAIMDRGQLIQFGAPDEVARMPANAFVAAFAGTNLAPAEEPGWQVAFDPWRVAVAPHATGAVFEWEARVRDLTRMGGFDRLRLVTPQGVSLFADVPVEVGGEAQRSVPHVNEDVCARVAEDDVRFVAAAAPAATTTSEEAGASEGAPEHPALAIRRRGLAGRRRMVGLLAGLVALVLIGGFAAPLGELIGGGGAAAGEAPGASMTALVAANMTEAFGRVEEVYEKRNPDAGIKASYAGTQVLFTQLQQGVPADLFIAADREYAERAKSQGLIEEFTPVAHMKPVVVVPEENPAGVESLRDLGESDLELVVGVENVPVGKYTRQVFRNAEAEYGAGFFDAVMDNVVSMETNTKQVTQKAATGAADAAVVYRTDVTPSVAEKVEIVEIPEAINAAATNYAAVKADADNPQLARRVIAFLRSPAAQDVVASFDYTRIESDR